MFSGEIARLECIVDDIIRKDRAHVWLNAPFTADAICERVDRGCGLLIVPRMDQDNADIPMILLLADTVTQYGGEVSFDYGSPPWLDLKECMIYASIQGFSHAHHDIRESIVREYGRIMLRKHFVEVEISAILPSPLAAMVMIYLFAF